MNGVFPSPSFLPSSLQKSPCAPSAFPDVSFHGSCCQSACPKCLLPKLLPSDRHLLPLFSSSPRVPQICPCARLTVPLFSTTFPFQLSHVPSAFPTLSPSSALIYVTSIKRVCGVLFPVNPTPYVDSTDKGVHILMVQ